MFCAGPVKGGSGQCTCTGETGATGEERAQAGAVQRTRNEREPGEAAYY